MGELIYILISVFVVSFVSLLGIFTIAFSDKFFNKILLILVAFAAGAMLGAVFFELIPETIKSLTIENAMILMLIGVILFFLIERLIHWHHYEEEKEKKVHPVSYLILIGDSVHNFGDGAIIAASYLVNIQLGMITTLAIIAHEIPHELGDFAVLVKSGFTKIRALFYNLLSAFTAVLGGIITYFVSGLSQLVVAYLIAIAAGGFLYIVIADLLPGLHEEKNNKMAILQFIFLIIGIVIILYFEKVFGV